MLLEELNWPMVQGLAPTMPVVVPVAALEQHGHHLPLFTDSMLLGEIVRRVSERFSETIVFAPLIWLGNSDHHLDFSGTLSLRPRVYLDMLSSVVDDLIRHGFRRIVILNGHGGNDVPIKQCLFERRQDHRHRSDLLLLGGTYWSLPREEALSPHGHAIHGMVQSEMGHACEWETSMMLAIAPQLVGDLTQLTTVYPGNPFRPGSRAWITRDRSGPGHIGIPQAASAEKGVALLQHFTEDVSHWLHRVIAWDGRSWEG